MFVMGPLSRLHLALLRDGPLKIMAQIFHRSANSLARASILGILLLVSSVGGGAASAALALRHRTACRAGAAVPFSHQHHAAGLGLDCRYCHTSVEDSSSPEFRPPKPA